MTSQRASEGSRAFACAVLLGLTIPVFAASPAFAADPGMIDHVTFTLTPKVQGVAGPVTATAVVYFATDPHRNLFVTDLQALIVHSAGVELSEGENPVIRPSVEVPPTVDLYPVTFTWRFTTVEVGTHLLTLLVTSAGSGEGAASANVTVREGVVVGNSVLSPPRPTTTAPLTFRVPVSSGFDDPSIPLNVTLFVYWNSAKVEEASANGSRLRLSTSEVVPGVRLRMDGQNGTYTYTIPPQPRGTLIYWIFVETPYNNVTSAPTRVFIEDPAVTGAVVVGALAAVLAFFSAGAGLILFDPAMRRPAKGSIHNSPDRLRWSLVVVAVGAVLFAYSMWIGVASEVWRRLFGYT